MEGPTVSSKVAIDKRVAWWRRLVAQPGYALFMLASPPVLLAVLIKLGFFHAGMGGGGYALYGALALIAAFGCFLLNDARDAQSIEAECPSCGSRTLWW